MMDRSRGACCADPVSALQQEHSLPKALLTAFGLTCPRLFRTDLKEILGRPEALRARLEESLKREIGNPTLCFLCGLL